MRGDDDLDKSPEKSSSQQWQEFKFFCPDSDEELYQNSSIPNLSDSDDIIPLSQIRAGDIVFIVKLIEIDCTEYLRNMGFLPRKKIQVISRTTTGSVVVVLENQRIGLGKDMAQSILVRK